MLSLTERVLELQNDILYFHVTHYIYSLIYLSL